jgi:ketosteroid isomerase-like protein
MKQIRFLTACVVLLWAAVSASATPDIRQRLAEYIGTLNRYDGDASLRFYTADAVFVHQQQREPIDRSANREYREFEAATHARFTYHIHKIDGDTADVSLAESNDFYRALGSATHKSRWLYRFHEDQIYEIVQVGLPNTEYLQNLRAFRDWILRARPEQARLVTSAGNVIFNGRTAAPITSLAREWQANQKNARQR